MVGTDPNAPATDTDSDVVETCGQVGVVTPLGPISVARVDEFTTADDTLLALDDVRAKIGSVPAEVVVVNHVMGLYELAAIHLSATPPRLADAALAIDAVACLIEGLGTRLGDEHTTLVDALANIRLAFVQIKGSGD